MRPSETSQGRRWLGNFPLEEHRAATLLIDSLRVISSSNFRIAMSDALDAAVNGFQAPVGVYPVRELPSGDVGQLLPLEHPFAAVPGSEALVGNIIRDVVGRRPRPERSSSYRS